MAWSDAARRAAAEARKRKAAGQPLSRRDLQLQNARIRRDFLSTELARQEKVWRWHVDDKNNEAANKVNDRMRRTRGYLRSAEKTFRKLRRRMRGMV
jgi:hypothetical protein